MLYMWKKVVVTPERRDKCPKIRSLESVYVAVEDYKFENESRGEVEL